MCKEILVSDAAREARVSYATALRWVHDGLIKSRYDKQTRRFFIPESEVLRMVNRKVSRFEGKDKIRYQIHETTLRIQDLIMQKDEIQSKIDELERKRVYLEMELDKT